MLDNKDCLQQSELDSGSNGSTDGKMAPRSYMQTAL